MKLYICLSADKWDDDIFIKSNEGYMIAIHQEKQRFVNAIS